MYTLCYNLLNNLNSNCLLLNHRPAWNRIKQQYPNYGINQGLTSKVWWKKFVKEVFNGAGYVSLCNNDHPHLERITERLYEQFGSNSSWKVTEGVPEMLTDLKKNGFKTAVVSNFDERLPLVLKQLNLDTFFDHLVTSVAARAEKPSTKIFEYALERAGVSAEESLHVGDSYEEDVLPARSIGMQAILFDEKHESDKSQKDCEAFYHFKCLYKCIV